MQTDIDIEEIRGLLGEVYSESGKCEPNWAIIQGNARQALSLLPPPCSTCGGSGKIPCKLCNGTHYLPNSNECDVCDGNGDIPCPCQAPAGDEFVKTFRRWLKALGTTDITNNQVRVKGYQACTHLAAQTKQISEQKKSRLEAIELVSQYNQQIAQLEAEKKRLSVVYIASNKTSSCAFESREDAEKYAGNAGAAAGIQVCDIPIIPDQALESEVAKE